MSTHISDFFDSEEILNRLYGIGTPVVAIFICFIVSAIIAFQDTQTLTKQEKLICKLNFILLAVAIVLCFLFLPIGILMIFAFFGYSIYTFHIFSVSQTSRSDNKILKTKGRLALLNVCLLAAVAFFLLALSTKILYQGVKGLSEDK